ncbi:MAG: hypothetical protein K0U98_01695 [Deltaproteobacteria bacterium]|nr:hypothetical protein [Deltaproteobacteria bacterium]
MKRGCGEVFPYLFLTLLVGGLAGFVWLIHHPESAWLEKAGDWPVVGKPLAHLRSVYLPESQDNSEGSSVQIAEVGAENSTEGARGGKPEEPLRIFVDGNGQGSLPPSNSAPAKPPAADTPGTRPAADSGSSSSGESRRGDDPLWATRVGSTTENSPATGQERLEKVEIVPGAVPTLPRPRRSRRSEAESAVVPWLAQEWIWVLPGNRVREEVGPEAEARVALEAMAHLPVLERQGNWAQVVFAGERGWVDTAWQPPYSRRKARRGILREQADPTVGSSADQLRKARQILGIRRPSRRLGAYDVYTDVEDEELLSFLDSAASHAEEAYFSRYGRLPSGNPRRTVVLFAREGDYRAYSESSFPGGGTNAGHAGSGVLAFFAEKKPRNTLARTLVHEITHLLNDRALARQLPTWLEEGLASDLGGLWIESAATVAKEGGARSSTLDVWRSIGSRPEVRLIHLAKIMDEGLLPPVRILWSLDYSQFHSPAIESSAYSHSAAVVRYLMDGEDGRFTEGFRTYLKRIAIGHGANPKLLLKILETDLETFDREFRSWVGAEAEAAQARLDRRVTFSLGR